MNLCGLTDSLATLHAAPHECPCCHTVSRIAQGLCLSCLLRTGVDEVEESKPEDLEAALDAFKVADTHWRLGNYEVLDEIGRGGMGVIYRARQRHSRRIVALKRILSYHADSRDTLVRFRREAEAAASLDHPNILPIYEVGESEEGVPYFSMKYAAGGSLQEVGPALREQPREIVRLMAKVARAVQYAHRQGILHRDLKPGNVLLDGRGDPLVCDFGLAKWLETSSDITRTLTIFGTPGFIAPEQAQGRATDLTASADVYSLGAILFDLLAGRPPFLGEHALAVIHQAAEKPAPRLRALVPGVDRDLETVCIRSLERDPKARYQSAGDLAEDLERWLEGRPILARPVSPPVQLWRWCCRKPALATSLAALLLLGSVAIFRQIETRRLSAAVRQDQLAAHSIAVLPFLNLDLAQPDDALTQAFAKSLQSNLSQFGPALVTPVAQGNPFWADTASASDIREANRSVKARTVLTGSQRLVKRKLRVSIRLVNAATGDNLLSRSLETAPGAAAGKEIDAGVAEAIYAVLTAKDWSGLTTAGRDPGLANETAREFITSGRQLMFRDTLQDMDRSLRCLERAIALEPKSAIAHAYLAASAGGRLHFGWDARLLAQAEREARQAIQLEPQLAEGHRALAGVFFQKGLYAEALEEQLRTVEIAGPEELVAGLVGMTFEKLGEPMRALGWLEMARHWASRPGDYDGLIGDCWSELGDDEKAENAYHRSMELRPESPEGWSGLCHLRLLQGEFAAARQLYQENHESSRRDKDLDTRPDEIAAQIEFFGRNFPEAAKLYRALQARDVTNGDGSYGSVSYDSALGRLQQLNGEAEAGLTSLRKARTRQLNSPTGCSSGEALFRLAAIDASLGDSTAALDGLQAAIAAGWNDLRSLRLDPRFDSIVAEPRFMEIVSRLGKKMSQLRQAAAGRAGRLTADAGERVVPEKED